MTDALALAPSSDVAVLAGLPVNEVDTALGCVWQSYGRRTVVDAWHIGRALHRVRDNAPGRAFSPYCERIGMTRSWAYQLLKIGLQPLDVVSCHRTVDGAVKALKAASSDPTPTPAPTPAPEVDAASDPTPTPPPPEFDTAAPEPQNYDAIMEEAAADSEPSEEERRDAREARIETFAMKTQDIEGDLVDGWMAKYEEQEARHQEENARHKEHDRITHQRHREDVQAINTGRRREQAKDRKDRDVCDALFDLPPSVGVDGVLAQFWNKARKTDSMIKVIRYRRFRRRSRPRLARTRGSAGSSLALPQRRRNPADLE